MKVQTNAADETLVALYAQGNNEAFDILLNRYKDRLYAYIYYTVRNEELAEDIFQETFTKAMSPFSRDATMKTVSSRLG